MKADNPTEVARSQLDSGRPRSWYSKDLEPQQQSGAKSPAVSAPVIRTRRYTPARELYCERR
jgi:hypothetical protein